MAYSFNGTNQFFNTASAPVTSEPLTLALWFRTNNNTSNNEMFSVAVSGSAGFATNAAGAIVGDPLAVTKVNGGTSGQARTSTGFAATTWAHGAGVYTSSTSRHAILNGAGKSENTTNVTTPSGSYRIDIASLRAASFMAGRIAEAAIWNAALTDDEVISLAKGFKPNRVRPQALVFYAALLKNVIDVRGGLTITNNNGATVENHPRVYG